VKIRSSFVSNSSSSSFILGFKKFPKSKLELMELLFPGAVDTDVIENSKLEWRTGSKASIGELVNKLFKILKKYGEKITNEQVILDHLSASDEVYKMTRRNKKAMELMKKEDEICFATNDEEYNEVKNKLDEYYMFYAKKLWDQIKGKFAGYPQLIYIDIGDSGNGEGQIGDVLASNPLIFDKIPHVLIMRN